MASLVYDLLAQYWDAQWGGQCPAGNILSHDVPHW